MNSPRKRSSFTFGLFLLCLFSGCSPTKADVSNHQEQQPPAGHRLLYKGIPMTNDSLRKAVNYYLKDTMVGEAVYGPIQDWDTSEVTDMSRLFEGLVDFHEAGIAQWNTAQVTSFAYMFAGCRAFDAPLDWDFASATTLEGMFNGATAYNQDVVGWRNTGSVTNMAAMFKGASHFNGNVGAGDTTTFGLVTDNVVDMNMMFYDATSFEGQGVETWNVANVERMDRMFMGASSFNGDVTGWTPQRVTTMQSMFEDAVVFNQDMSAGWRGKLSYDLAVLSQMFYHAQSFDHQVCWTGLSPRISTSKMFCGSPGSLNPSCFSNPSILHWTESCTAADANTVVGNNNNDSPGFAAGSGSSNNGLNEDNFVVVGSGANTNGTNSEAEEDKPEMVIVGVTGQKASAASTSMGATMLWMSGGMGLVSAGSILFL